MNDQVSIRTLKRLTAAEGYLELDMPDYALEELEGITDFGPFEGVVDWMKGEALKEKQEFEAAIQSLQRAVQEIPAPHNRSAMQTLTECLRSTGQDELADIAETFTALSGPDASEPSPLPQLNIPLNFLMGPWGRSSALPEAESE